MRGFAYLAMLGVIAGGCATCNGDDRLVSGVVVDTAGKPVQDVDVSAVWTANGSRVTADGTPLDISDDRQLAEFWGHLGEMQPTLNAKRRAVTNLDGAFAFQSHSWTRVLFAIDSTRKRGGTSIIPHPYNGQKIQIRLVPLVTVHARVRSIVGARSVYWSHAYVEIPEDSKNPLGNERFISCGSFEGRLRFQVPPGSYKLDVCGISKNKSEDTDLQVQPSPAFTVDGTQWEVNLGVLELTLAPPDRGDLEALAKEQGQWRDYTKHYGELAPDWHAVDARGVEKGATIKDFRGKWVLIDFWGFSCSPCLSNGIPKMMDFYEQHADQKDHFEIVSVCIDYTGELKSMRDVDAAAAPIVTHVWNGRSIEFPIVLDNTFETWQRYGIPGLGTTVLVDPSGKVVEGDETTLKRILKSLKTENSLRE